MKQLYRLTFLGLCVFLFSCAGSNVTKITKNDENISKNTDSTKKIIQTYPTKGVLYFMYGEIYRSMGNINFANLEYQRSLKYDTTATILNAIADSYVLLGKTDEARKYYERSMYLDSLNSGTREKLTRLYLMNGEIDRAIPHLEEIYKKKPDDPAVLKTLAESYRKNGQPDSALTILGKMEALTPDIPWIYVYAAEIQRDMGDPCRAAQSLEKAIDISGGDDNLFMFTLQMLYSCKSTKAIGQLLERWIASDTKLLEPHVMYLDYHFQSGDMESMERELQRVVHRRDESWEISYFQMLSSMRSGDTLAVDRHFNYSGEFETVRPDLYVRYANWNRRAGRYKKAMKAVELAMRRFGESSDWLYLKAVILRFSKRPDDATTSMERAVLLEPDNPELAADLAQFYWHDGYTSEADSIYRQLLKKLPENDVIKNNYAYFLAENDMQPEKAMKLICEAWKINKKASYADTRAWVLYRQEKYRPALRWSRKSQRLSSNPGVEIFYHRGRILQALGKDRQAAEAYKKCLNIQSGYEPARSALKEIK